MSPLCSHTFNGVLLSAFAQTDRLNGLYLGLHDSNEYGLCNTTNGVCIQVFRGAKNINGVAIDLIGRSKAEIAGVLIEGIRLSSGETKGV